MYSVNKKSKKKDIINRNLRENPVEDYLRDHPNLVISSKKLSKILDLKNKKSVLYATNSDNIVRVAPVTIGSGKYYLDIYKYKSN